MLRPLVESYFWSSALSLTHKMVDTSKIMAHIDLNDRNVFKQNKQDWYSAEWSMFNVSLSFYFAYIEMKDHHVFITLVWNMKKDPIYFI